MFNWNGVKINIEGNVSGFISEINKYFYADYVPLSEDYDIRVRVNINDKNKFYPPPKPPKRIRAFTLLVGREIHLDIYEYEQEICYIYENIASVLVDLENNLINIDLGSEIFPFSYYNILLFFLNPLGLILSNFGFNRAHSSCVYIKNSSIIFTGNSGDGKSTSAFAINAHGGFIVSDDITYFKSEKGKFYPYTLSGLAKLQKYSVDTFFRELLNYNYLENDEGEFYFNLNDLNGESLKHPPARAIVILKKTMVPDSDYQQVHPTTVIPQIFPSSIRPGSRNTARNFKFITDLLDRLPCYQVSFGTNMSDFFLTIQNMMHNELK